MAKSNTAELRVRLDAKLMAAVRQAAAASRQTPSEVIAEAVAFAHELAPRLAILMDRIEVVIGQRDEVVAALCDIADYVASYGNAEDAPPSSSGRIQ